MNEDFEFNEYDIDNSGLFELSDSSESENSESEVVTDSDSVDTVDYSSYFEDIITDIESLIGFYDEDVSLSDLHKDITITNFLILFFIVLFCGNKLINRIRGL